MGERNLRRKSHGLAAPGVGVRWKMLREMKTQRPEVSLIRQEARRSAYWDAAHLT